MENMVLNCACIYVFPCTAMMERLSVEVEYHACGMFFVAENQHYCSFTGVLWPSHNTYIRTLLQLTFFLAILPSRFRLAYIRPKSKENRPPSPVSHIKYYGRAQKLMPLLCRATHRAHLLHVGIYHQPILHHLLARAISRLLSPSLPPFSPPPPPPPPSLLAGCVFVVMFYQTSVIQTAMSTVAKTLVTFPKEATIVKVSYIGTHVCFFCRKSPHMSARMYPTRNTP